MDRVHLYGVFVNLILFILLSIEGTTEGGYASKARCRPFGTLARKKFLWTGRVGDLIERYCGVTNRRLLWSELCSHDRLWRSILSITNRYKFQLHIRFFYYIFFIQSSIFNYIMTRTFVIQGKKVTVCPRIPNDVTKLIIANTHLTSLPSLPIRLKKFLCKDNSFLTSLPALPSGLTELDCWGNQLTSLPTLPSGLTKLVCSSNQLTSLPTLPSGLKELYCGNNQLTSLPSLPSGLETLGGSSMGKRSVWCERIKDAQRIGLNPKKTALLLRFACKAIAQQEVKLIQRDCDRWLDAPVTNDGRLGILLRIGMREGAGYGTWTGQEMWSKNKDGKVIWAGNDVDKETWSMYPPK